MDYTKISTEISQQEYDDLTKDLEVQDNEFLAESEIQPGEVSVNLYWRIRGEIYNTIRMLTDEEILETFYSNF